MKPPGCAALLQLDLFAADRGLPNTPTDPQWGHGNGGIEDPDHAGLTHLWQMFALITHHFLKCQVAAWQ